MCLAHIVGVSQTHGSEKVRSYHGFSQGFPLVGATGTQRLQILEAARYAMLNHAQTPATRKASGCLMEDDTMDEKLIPAEHVPISLFDTGVLAARH